VKSTRLHLHSAPGSGPDHERSTPQSNARPVSKPRLSSRQFLQHVVVCNIWVHCTTVARKNSIRLPSDRDVGTCLFGLRDLENPGSQLGWQKYPSALASSTRVCRQTSTSVCSKEGFIARSDSRGLYVHPNSPQNPALFLLLFLFVSSLRVSAQFRCN
jgi:hypothetical protein